MNFLFMMIKVDLITLFEMDHEPHRTARKEEGKTHFLPQVIIFCEQINYEGERDK